MGLLVRFTLLVSRIILFFRTIPLRVLSVLSFLCSLAVRFLMLFIVFLLPFTCFVKWGLFSLLLISRSRVLSWLSFLIILLFLLTR